LRQTATSHKGTKKKLAAGENRVTVVMLPTNTVRGDGKAPSPIEVQPAADQKRRSYGVGWSEEEIGVKIEILLPEGCWGKQLSLGLMNRSRGGKKNSLREAKKKLV